MHDRAFWTRLAGVARAGGRAGLVALVEGRGSAPNRPGAKLALPRDGEPFGTVGGGISEWQLLERVRARLREGPVPPEVVRLAHNPENPRGVQSGMICGGTQTFVLCDVEPGDLPVLERLATEDEVMFRLGPDGLSASVGGRGCSFADGDAWRYEEPVGPLDRLFIVGGGHVGLALARVMRDQDFRVVVLDNRPEWVEARRAEAAEPWRCVDYARIDREIPEGDRVFVCIVTHGHVHDGVVLERLAGKPLRYLGLMGSRRKVAELFARMEGLGVPAARLEHVHAPIGLPIGSQTPEEIAISVAAELIREKNLPPAGGAVTSTGETPASRVRSRRSSGSSPCP